MSLSSVIFICILYPCSENLLQIWSFTVARFPLACFKYFFWGIYMLYSLQQITELYFSKDAFRDLGNHPQNPVLRCVSPPWESPNASFSQSPLPFPSPGSCYSHFTSLAFFWLFHENGICCFAQLFFFHLA